MKILRLLIIPALALGVMLSLGSCGNSGHSHDGHSHEEHSHDGHSHSHDDHSHEAAMPHGDGPEYTSQYVCPMHCEGSGSSEPGKCPVCNMDYVLGEEHVKDGHSHGGSEE